MKTFHYSECHPGSDLMAGSLCSRVWFREDLVVMADCMAGNTWRGLALHPAEILRGMVPVLEKDWLIMTSDLA